MNIACIVLLALVFILLSIIMAFLYDKYLNKRKDDMINMTVTKRNCRRHRNEDIESSDMVIEEKEETDNAMIGEQTKQSFERQCVNDYTQTSVKTFICSKSSLQLEDNKDNNGKTVDNSPEMELTSASVHSERSTLSTKYCSPKSIISDNNLMPKNNSTPNSSIDGNNGRDSMSNFGNYNTIPKRMRLSSVHSFSRTDDLIVEMDAIIDQTFDSLKSTIDCMNYDTLRYSCEDLS